MTRFVDWLRGRAARDVDPKTRDPGTKPDPTRRQVEAPSDGLCGITDIGRTRDHNEDRFYLSGDGKLVIVADGMGGHNAGEVASAMAVESIANTYDRLLGDESLGAGTAVSSADVEGLLSEAFREAHDNINGAAAADPDRHEMGTTLIAGLIRDSWLYTCHVGDVRCYVRTGDSLVQITNDHTPVGSMVRAGQLTPEQARQHPERNVIDRAIGLSSAPDTEFHAVEIGVGTCVILCSDGLWEALSDDEISSVLGWEGSTRQRATQLVDRANAAGGFDNITAVVYEHAER